MITRPAVMSARRIPCRSHSSIPIPLMPSITRSKPRSSRGPKIHLLIQRHKVLCAIRPISRPRSAIKRSRRAEAVALKKSSSKIWFKFRLTVWERYLSPETRCAVKSPDCAPRQRRLVTRFTSTQILTAPALSAKGCLPVRKSACLITRTVTAFLMAMITRKPWSLRPIRPMPSTAFFPAIIVSRQRLRGMSCRQRPRTRRAILFALPSTQMKTFWRPILATARFHRSGIRSTKISTTTAHTTQMKPG